MTQSEMYRKYSIITLVLHCHWVPSGTGDENVSLVIRTHAKVLSILISHAGNKILMVTNVFVMPIFYWRVDHQK